MELKGKRVMVLGLARTGIAAARFLAEQGADVIVSDRRGGSELSRELSALAGTPAHFFFGGEDRAWLENIDLVVPSPGVPQENPLLKEAARRGIAILSEIELGY